MAVRVRVLNESWVVPVGEGHVVGKGLRVNVLPGLSEIIRAFQKAAASPAVMLACALAAKKEGDRLLALTQLEVPVDTEELKKSGRVEGPIMTDKFQYVNIVYGGPAGAGRNTIDVDYAVYVHEDLYAQHKHGKAKFVEDPVRTERESGRTLENFKADIVPQLDRAMAILAAEASAAAAAAAAKG